MIKEDLKRLNKKDFFELLEIYMDFQNYSFLNNRHRVDVIDGEHNVRIINSNEISSLLDYRNQLTPVGFKLDNFKRTEFYIENKTDELYIYHINVYKDINELEKIEIFKRDRTII